MEMRRARSGLLLIAAIYPVAIGALSLLNLVAPQRDGPLALTQILAPHLAASVLLLVPLALLRDARALRVGLAVTLVVAAVRFGPGMASLPPAAVTEGAPTLRLMTWNLEVGAPAASEIVSVVAAADVDVVAFEELTPEIADAVTADPQLARRFAFRAIYAEPGTGGIGLLSRYPLSSLVRHARPIAVEADVLVGGATVHVAAGHPYPAAIGTATSFRLPVAFDARRRDADIATFRGWIEPVIAARRPIVVIGDFNVTDREPAYRDLARGLADAQLEVGEGIGSTWRPDRMKFLPFGVLRIDYVLAGGGIRPLDVAQDCTPRGSDHCIVVATVVVGIDPAP